MHISQNSAKPNIMSIATRKYAASERNITW